MSWSSDDFPWWLYVIMYATYYWKWIAVALAVATGMLVFAVIV